MIPSKEEEHQKDVRKRHVIHMLANEKVLLNNTIGRNRNFKHEIDIARKEISFAKLSNETMTTTINQLKFNISNIANETINSNRMAGETNNQILALKAKHEEEKESFEVEIKKLQERLKERDDPIEFDDKSFNQ